MAQGCFPDNIPFITQAQIDDFLNNYPDWNKK